MTIWCKAIKKKMLIYKQHNFENRDQVLFISLSPEIISWAWLLSLRKYVKVSLYLNMKNKMRTFIRHQLLMIQSYSLAFRFLSQVSVCLTCTPPPLQVIVSRKAKSSGPSYISISNTSVNKWIQFIELIKILQFFKK